MFKKLIAAGLVLSTLFTTGYVTYAADIKLNEEIIIEQALALNKGLDLEVADVYVVTIGANSNARVTSEGEQVIQSISTTDDITAVTTIIPYTLSEDGELINSFENNSAQSERSMTDTIEPSHVDFTFSYTAYFNNVSEYGKKLYKHIGLGAVWNSSVDTISIENIFCKFEAVGDLYNYPDLSTCYDTNDTRTSIVNVINPDRGVYYYDMSSTMETNRVHWLVDTSDGAKVTFSVRYNDDGNVDSVEDYVGTVIYSKNQDAN